MQKRLLLLFATLIVFAWHGFSAPNVWKDDPAHSSVQFRVAHLVISEVTGFFKEFDATLTTGKDDYSDAKLEATIKVASIFTDNDRRDGHLRSGDFFDAEKYPTITFRSTSFTKTGDSTFKIAGDLTIRDVTKPVVLDAIYKGQVSMGGRSIIVFSATAEIDRFDYGVKWDAKLDTGGLVAGEKVKIQLDFEGVKQ